MTTVFRVSRVELSGNVIKTVAIVAMLIDHIAWSFVPTYTVLGQMMHVFGRITAPLMCFMITEGYAHTHSIDRYFKRLFIFAILSDLPFMIFERSNQRHNVIFTLLFGLWLIWLWDNSKNRILKAVFAVLVCWIAFYFNSDWSFIGVLFCLAFWIFRGEFLYQALTVVGFSIIAALQYGQAFQLGMILCLPFLYFYNGQRGGGSKWLFYAFYPAHLAVLGFLRGIL